MGDLQPGDLLLCRSKGIVGVLIRFGERTRVHGWRIALGRAVRVLFHRSVDEGPDDPAWTNHVAVYVGGGQVIEAVAKGLQLASVEKYGPDVHVVARLANADPGIGLVERQALVEFAHAELDRHTSYGWLSIASIVLQLLTPTKLDVSWDGAVICSAFGAQCWEHSGVVMNTRSSLTTMPSDFWGYVG